MNPAETGTFGVFRSDITKMRIGDYTCAMYALDTTDDPLSAAQRDEINTVYVNQLSKSSIDYLGKFSQLGTADQNTPEFNVSHSSYNLNGLVWLVKIKKGVLMPTRCLIRGNYATIGYYFGLVNGRKITIDDRDFIMQIPSIDDYQTLISDMGSNTAEALKKLIEDDFYIELVRNYYRYPEQAEGVPNSSTSPTFTSTLSIETTRFSTEADYNRNLDEGYVVGDSLTAHWYEYSELQLKQSRFFRPVLKYVDDPRCQSIYV